MPTNRPNRSPFLLLCGLGLIVLFYFYGAIIVQPNHYLFSIGGDGIKNYFTYAWHIQHDSSFIDFEGMNYPYGEHYLYTDCHPALANVLKEISAIFPGLPNVSIGILNVLMLSSIFLTMLVLFFLLVEFEVGAWYSVFFSLAIGGLAPQLFRIDSHLALSYSVAIPLSWLLILRAMRNPKAWRIGILFLNNVFWLFTHAYLGMIIIAFLFAFWGIRIVQDKERKSNFRWHSALGLAILVPVAFFYGYVSMTDTHVGRTDNPSGFFLYNAELDDVLVPPGPPLRPLLNQISGNQIKLEWEAAGYIGAVNAMVLLFLLGVFLYGWFNRRVRRSFFSLYQDEFLTGSLAAAFVVLLFAFAFPFKQIPGLIDWFPVFKQFRATGRFVWPFYFVFPVYVAHVIQLRFLSFSFREKKQVWRLIAFGVFILLSLAEGYFYHARVSADISRFPNLFDEQQLTVDLQDALEAIDPNAYQAMISLPFFYQGSEVFGRPRDDWAVRNALILGYHTGLPNVCANLTRTSIQESKHIIQLISPNYYDKPIRNDLKDDRPFLLVKTGRPLTDYEQLMWAKGETILDNDRIALRSISLDQLFSDDRSSILDQYERAKEIYTPSGSFLISDPDGEYYYYSFDELPSDTTFYGAGAYAAQKAGQNVFVAFPTGTFRGTGPYHLSIWMYNGVPDALNLWFRLIVEEFDEETDERFRTVVLPEQAETIAGDWSLVEMEFELRDPNNPVFFQTVGKPDSKANLHVDELLIREADLDVFRVDSVARVLFLNGQRVTFLED